MILTDLGDPKPREILGLHPHFERAFSEMTRLISENACEGRYDICGDALFINVMSYDSKPQENCLFETHREYIDIQAVMSGKEKMGFADLDRLTVCEPYRPDCELYSMVDDMDTVTLSEGKICIIFPEEPHAPGIAIEDSPAAVKKLVAKIKVK